MAKSKVNEWLEHDKLVLLEGWARSGLTNEQIAKNIGISPKTLYEWQNKHSDIRNTLKKGKEVVDFEVENALLKRALGYKYMETTKELIKNPKTKQYELKITKEIEKEVPPDTTAQIYWLKNRKPLEWRDKIQIENNESAKAINDNLQNIAKLLNNPQPNRSEDDIQ